jgi:DNA-nicking Smr family endonuclease
MKMARRKKRKRPSQNQKARKNEPEIFNPAFDGLSSLDREKAKTVQEPETPKPTEPQKKPDETRVFFEAMADVTPLNRSRDIVARTPDVNLRPSHPAPDDELEAMAHLSDLVSGAAEMDIRFSDEYIEGCVQGFDQKLMQKIKKGQFPVQDYVDLHGLTKQEAEIRMRDFLLQSHRFGLRCVLVVHGRGLNSQDNIPVLKERLPIWLNRSPVKRFVLAFSTAMPYDGGTGAIYILLRKRRGAV